MAPKTCFFIGHRKVPEDIRDRLREAIERHITDYGVTSFVVGHYGEYDWLVAGVLVEAKRRHPEIEALVLLPYHPQDHPYEVPKGLDGTYYPPGQERMPKALAIVRANEYMIRHSDYLICYNRGDIGKTRDFMAIAARCQEKGILHIENLATAKLGIGD